MKDNDFLLYGRSQLALVEKVKYIENTKIFSGWISVRMLQSNERMEWVRWSNPLMGKTYGIFTVPVPLEDVVVVGFDLFNIPVVTGMVTQAQAKKAIDELQAFDDELTDNRFIIEEGELVIRSKAKSRIHFKNDGSTIFQLNDENANTTSITIDIAGNVILNNVKNLQINGEQINTVVTGNVKIKSNADVNVESINAIVKAAKVDIQSGDIGLGNGTQQSIIRSTDRVQHIDPVLGIPVISQSYLGHSSTTKAS